MRSPRIDPEIRDYLSYDRATGIFRWCKVLPLARGIAVGDRAGRIRKSGYREIKFKGRYYRASRLAWFFVHGCPPPDDIEIDHRNGRRHDDRIKNLRLATRLQNAKNRKPVRLSNSRFKGVTFNKASRRWQAGIKVGGKNKYLGLFGSEEDAARAYDAVAIAAHGDFARLNFPIREAA